jgi:hypothetical protein
VILLPMKKWRNFISCTVVHESSLHPNGTT